MVAPLALLLANSDWFFTPEGFLDPWNYIGLFKQYLDPDYLPEDYKLGRLPWVLAGFLVHSALPPVPAAYVLHAVFLCATSLGLYIGLFATLRRSVLAAVVTMCFAFYAPAHGSGGWDYHNTAAGAFYLWTFALLALPSTLDGRRTMLIVSGALAAAAIHANITLVNFLPALAFVYVRGVHVRSGRGVQIREQLERIGWVALGALLTTVALGLINWEVGRPFLFFGSLLNAVVRVVGDPQNVQEFHQPAGWWWTARYLALPCAVAIAGVIFVISAGRRRTTKPADALSEALVLQFLAMALLWVLWQAAGQITLDVEYFAYVLIPSSFIALAGILSRRWRDWCERHWLVTVVATALSLFICLTTEAIPGVQSVAAFIAPVSFVAISALFLLGLAGILWRPAVASVAVLIATFALGNRLVAGSPNYFVSDPCKVQPAVYGAIVEAASWLMTEVDPLYTRARIWFDEDQSIEPIAGCAVRLSDITASLTTMASMGYVARPVGDVEALPAENVAALASGDRILVILTNEPASLAAWRQRLDREGMTHEEIGQRRVNVLGSGFMMHAWKARASAP